MASNYLPINQGIHRLHFFHQFLCLNSVDLYKCNRAFPGDPGDTCPSNSASKQVTFLRNLKFHLHATGLWTYLRIC